MRYTLSMQRSKANFFDTALFQFLESDECGA
jgi:hypothetical protein